MKNRKTWAVVVVYAAAMAWVESAVVYYMRTMIDRIDPYQPTPLPVVGNMGFAELVREAATLAMLLAVGMLAGRTWRSAGLCRGRIRVWDVLYYVYLKVLCGWPHSMLGLGHSISPAFAVVGPVLCAGGDCSGADRLGHAGLPI